MFSGSWILDFRFWIDTLATARVSASLSPLLLHSSTLQISRHLMNFPVVAFVAAVDVVEDVRMDHRVIKRGVKVGRLLRRAARDFDLRKLFVPRRLRIRTNLVEIPVWQLGFEI